MFKFERTAHHRVVGWGPWHLDESVGVLWTREAGYRYEINLERIDSAGTVLDFIAQITNKDWGKPEVVGWLVRAFNDLSDLQGTVCGCGKMSGRIRWDMKEAQFVVTHVQ